MPDLLALYQARGFLQDATPGLAARLARGPVTAYIGFDPTADSLHVGNMVPVMGLAWLQRAGGTPIALLGAGTAMVGDPSGKRTERPVLSVEQIDANAAAIRAQLGQFLRFPEAATHASAASRSNDARMRNNADWLRRLGLMEFLRDTGKHFTVSYMLQKESVKSRMETGISYTEFSYMLVQAYDYWHLFKEENCELQMGGSDQWGNITAGIELVSRRESREVHGLVFPLITTSSGAKFGKSEGENIWLDPARTSPYKFYQFWLNTDDRDVERYLKLFTFLELDEIAELVAAQQKDPAARPAQRRLASVTTALVHGEAEAEKARAASEALFGRGPAGTRTTRHSRSSRKAATSRSSQSHERRSRRCRSWSSWFAADSPRRRPTPAGVSREAASTSTASKSATRIACSRATTCAGRSWVLLRKGKKNYVKVVLQ